MKINFVSNKAFDIIERYIMGKVLVRDIAPGPKFMLYINDKLYVRRRDKYAWIRLTSRT
jgi:hypothetical protein